MSTVSFKLVVLWGVLSTIDCRAASVTGDDRSRTVARVPNERGIALRRASQKSATADTSAAAGSTSQSQPPGGHATETTPTPQGPAGSANQSSHKGVRRACLQYEPQPVSIQGAIQRVTFPGPPNYDSVAKGDTPETCWLLKLDQPACVDASPGDEIDVAHSRIDTVQLVLDGEAYDRYRNLVGQRVEASGELFGSHTGHHHTEVLLIVRDLRPWPGPHK